MIEEREDRPLNIPTGRIGAMINILEPYLKSRLLPFWLNRAVDREYGGFLTYFDRLGQRTGQTRKTLVMQLRMIFTLASSHRAGYGLGRCAEAAAQGLDFVLDHFWDREYGGWYWTTDRQGRVLDDGKIMYGQSFGIFALSEYFLAFAERRSLDHAVRTFDLVESRARDGVAGGFWEMFRRDWSRKPPGVHGGDRKTFDVHMHLMEAFTALFEATREAGHGRRLEETIHIVIGRMLHPEH